MRELLIYGLVSLWFTSPAASSQHFDLVLKGGRVVDPETGLDAIRDVAIRGDTIARISTEPLSGTRVIDVRGLVVAPGFIDLHQHQQDAESYRLKALDGVTTALELETGVPDVARFLEARRGQALIHHGAAASHEAARILAWGEELPASVWGPAAGIPDPPAGPVTDGPSPDRLARLLELLRAQLDAGALGVGMAIQYTPGATRREVIALFRLAAEYRVPVIAHLRYLGRTEPGSAFEALEEVIAAAVVTGASLHVAHVNSMCLRDSPDCLSLIEGARARGMDITVEAYPYGAGVDFINSVSLDPGWREKYGIDYHDLELAGTGERLTQERFEILHAAPEPRIVIEHLNPDDIVDAVVRHPLVMIASDGVKEHPRNAGSYCRVLARYVRLQGSLALMDAIRKMSLMPAQRLEGATAAARRKGRLQEGKDADVVVFDAQRIQDRATYRSPTQPSVGVRYLIVGGTPVVAEGRIVDGVFPGRPLTAEVTPR